MKVERPNDSKTICRASERKDTECWQHYDTCGMLSTLQSKARTPKTIHCYSDNIGLIQQIDWNKSRITTTPKDVTQPDYDIEAKIRTAINKLRTINITVDEKHVRGHQNRTMNIENLSTNKRRNVIADIKAAKALKNHQREDKYN
jgi:hypothetical protein